MIYMYLKWIIFKKKIIRLVLLYLRLYVDTESSPGYEISYIIQILAICGASLFLIVVDSLFVGVGLHIVAGYKDLQDMILKIDETIKYEIFLNEIKFCIKFHNFLLRLVYTKLI